MENYDVLWREVPQLLKRGIINNNEQGYPIDEITKKGLERVLSQFDAEKPNSASTPEELIEILHCLEQDEPTRICIGMDIVAAILRIEKDIKDRNCFIIADILKSINHKVLIMRQYIE